MTLPRILIGLLLGRAVALLACLAGAAHERLDRAARTLNGGQDAIDQHHAEAVRAVNGRHAAPDLRRAVG